MKYQVVRQLKILDLVLDFDHFHPEIANYQYAESGSIASIIPYIGVKKNFIDTIGSKIGSNYM